MLRVIRGSKGSLTLGQVMLASGLPRAEAEPALQSLIRKFRCVLRVTDTGEILYDFGDRIRDRVTFQDRLREVWLRAQAHLAAIARFIFRVGFLAILVLYGLFYIVIFAALLSRGGSSGDIGMLIKDFLKLIGNMAMDIGRRRGDPVSAILHVPAKAPDAQTSDDGSRDRVVEWLGCSLRTLEERAAATALQDRVFAFVFGPSVRHWEGRERDRAFLAYVMAHQGWAGATDWVLLFGTPLDEAEREVARVYAEYGADVQVTDDGSIVYDFRSMLPTDAAGGAEVASSIRPPDTFPRVQAASWALARDTKGALVTIGFCALNAVGSIALFFLLRDAPQFASNLLLRLAVVWVPLGFSVAVFLLLALRGVFGASARGTRRVMASMLVLLSELGHKEVPVAAGEVSKVLKGETPDWLTESTLRQHMPDVNRWLGAEMKRTDDATEKGKWVYPCLSQEFSDLKRLRASGDDKAHVGGVVYSTQDGTPI